MKHPYIPAGCDQQGRLESGRFASEEDQSQGLTLGEKLYCYGLIVLGFIAFVSVVAWVAQNVRVA